MKKTIIALAAAVLALTACKTEDLPIHPETRTVVSKNAANLTYVCRSSWTDGNGTKQHKDQTKGATEANFAKIKIGDTC